MRKFMVLICGTFVLLAAPLSGWVRATTIYASSTSYDHVAEAVSKASYGDTVVVPAGRDSVVWDSILTLTKGIHLEGPGRESLTINIGSIGDFGSLIIIEPDATSRANGHVFEVSGFRFNGNNLDRRAITLSNSNRDYFGVVKIHGNTFEAIGSSSGGYPIGYSGHFKGVVFHNLFTNNQRHSIRYHADNANTWNWIKWYDYGTSNVVFFEDNTFLNEQLVMSSGGHGQSVVIRYNNITAAESMWPLIDGHGNQGSGVAGMMGMEIYRNVLSGTGTERIDMRGGRTSFWGNTASGAVYSPRVRNDNCNNLPGTAARDPNTQTFEIQNSYHFLNCNGSNLVHTGRLEAGCYTEIPENEKFWNQNQSYNPGVSTSLLTGIGVGTKVQMNMVTSCTAGVGFWVTDEGNWDINNPGYSGRLYRCTEGNAWELYYTPYHSCPKSSLRFRES